MEPVYQWIPELNKRVFSDKYEKFIDKEYDLSEDLENLLDIYRKMQTSTTNNDHKSDFTNNNERDDELDISSNLNPMDLDADLSLSRRKLAQRLGKLAKMGGPKSRQLLELLRHSLHMDPLEQTRFRALRLIQPTSEMSGKFSCSVSSLDAQDLQWRQLTIYGKFVSREKKTTTMQKSIN